MVRQGKSLLRVTPVRWGRWRPEASRPGWRNGVEFHPGIRYFHGVAAPSPMPVFTSITAGRPAASALASVTSSSSGLRTA
jgi:hypothetical protein